jgi:hypothetical protein
VVKDRDVLSRQDPGQQTAAFAAEQQLRSGQLTNSVIITHFALTNF